MEKPKLICDKDGKVVNGEYIDHLEGRILSLGLVREGLEKKIAALTSALAVVCEDSERMYRVIRDCSKKGK